MKSPNSLCSLQDWINEIGIESVAKLLKVNAASVRHWRRGHCLPRTGQMYLIQRYSKGRVTYEEMINTYHESQKSKKA